MLSNREVMHRKSDMAMIGRVMRLLRKGAISRAWKAMESKGLGDLRDSEIIQHMHDKHKVRMKQIGPDVFAFIPEEEVELKVDKIMGKLSNDAALGLAGLRNTYVKMQMGSFAPDTTETAIENQEDLITHMANDKLPPWFMQSI
jgi:hypothetical protein